MSIVQLTKENNLLDGRGEQIAADHNPWETKYSKYGYQMDVRASYNDLPFQFFWTWLTGKDGRDLEPRKPIETLLTNTQLGLQILWSWSIILTCLTIGYFVYHSTSLSFLGKAAITIPVWVLVTNRTRGLLHTFHYTNHGASIRNERLAKFLGKWFMSVPILHLSWNNYYDIHARLHHGAHTLCTGKDPDEVFMLDHGFYAGMPEREFWTKLVLAPFNPKAIWNHIAFRLKENFVTPERSEIISRAAFWIIALAIVYETGFTPVFIIYYLIPLLLITQFASWLQHTTEHLWFAKRPDDVSMYVYYGSMTWGRFQGRPYPLAAKGFRGFLERAQWWLLVIVVDIPIKLFSFMQDLPSHDFHHRSPKVNFWSISRERRAHEGKESKFGPMTEVWSLVESWKIIRDHVCYGESDPFAVWQWDRDMHQSAENSVAI